MKIPPILLAMAPGLVRGQRPEDLARAVDGIVASSGGNPLVFWRVIHEMAVKRLGELGADPVERPEGPLVECGSCGAWKSPT